MFSSLKLSVLSCCAVESAWSSRSHFLSARETEEGGSDSAKVTRHRRASVTHFLLSTVIFVRRQTMGLLLERSAFARVHSCAHFVVADINMRKCFILRKKSCGQTRSREDLHKPASWHCCLFFCLFSLVRSPTQRDYYSNIRRAPSAEYHLIS